MQNGQATGIDMKAMLPVFAAVYMVAAELFLPWVSFPELKYADMDTVYTLWELPRCVENIQRAAESGVLAMTPLTRGETGQILMWAGVLRAAALILCLLLLAAVAAALKWKKKSAPYVRVTMALSALLPAAVFAGVLFWNILLNRKMGVPVSFISLTLDSSIQLTSYAYAQLILGIFMAVAAGKLLDTQFEYKASMYMERSVRTDRGIGKRTKISLLLILVAIPFVIFFGIFFLNDRSQLFIALCIIGLSMIPFCMVFEERRPQAREILLIAVMAALAVVGRVAFFMLPQFKPVSAIVIITGIALGPEAGFLTGAVAGFVSNFFFGQGPWTPWQMFAFGIIGFLAGLIFKGRRKKQKKGKLAVCIYGGVATLVIYGLLLDTASVVMSVSRITWEVLLAYYISGFWFNVIHGVSTVIFLFFLLGPMERKLERIRKKYGIIEV